MIQAKGWGATLCKLPALSRRHRQCDQAPASAPIQNWNVAGSTQALLREARRHTSLPGNPESPLLQIFFWQFWFYPDSIITANRWAVDQHYNIAAFFFFSPTRQHHLLIPDTAFTPFHYPADVRAGPFGSAQCGRSLAAAGGGRHAGGLDGPATRVSVKGYPLLFRVVDELILCPLAEARVGNYLTSSGLNLPEMLLGFKLV